MEAWWCERPGQEASTPSLASTVRVHPPGQLSATPCIVIIQHHNQCRRHPPPVAADEKTISAFLSVDIPSTEFLQI